ncbi:2-oxo-4-hydroxy-4-carboxy-5-ureidoimidazoline decarboxylase [Nocardia stercoris]|uniref:2-oxo-4-hydroxy-4-carboxy-5-ureidoimidazoline decarboxylase n=1 Tax=Nocardia stercoris TaxID=2483361 RepID=A0A3M2L3D4_9NOCA|nr:2-oxo-4-hydroxy-4-carboxy-5-ureidoimidazoline decarboxylase [Nocardia stercoris]RMI31023.1 2-oxo-4-hydroxy-4-carboxy-5-ureidoimidazoline decarboxylase [Nocardia stercoris]
MTILDLPTFHTLPDAEAARALQSCCAAPGWVRALTAGRPYRRVSDLLAVSDAEVAAMSDLDLDVAMAAHPRIGAPPEEGAAALEQAGVATAGDDVRAALDAWNREYEAAFGHVYLVCASGRSAAEMLDDLMARMRNTPEAERAVVRGELAKINRIRLRRLFAAEEAQ